MRKFCSFLNGCLSVDKVERRLKLLKLEELGFSQAEVVNELSQKLSCSKRVLYKDFESSEVWQPLCRVQLSLMEFC